MTDTKNKFDHPCRETCSGWKQGYERGMADANPCDTKSKEVTEDLTQVYVTSGDEQDAKDCLKALDGEDFGVRPGARRRSFISGFHAGRAGMMPASEVGSLVKMHRLKDVEANAFIPSQVHTALVAEAVKSERDRCWGVVVTLWETVCKGPRGEIYTPFSDAIKKISQGSNSPQESDGVK